MKKTIFILILALMFLYFVTAVDTTISQPSVCCEKTTDGKWCINAPEASCDSNYKKASTSCEYTSYCKQGTCYDSAEGICLDNTPQRVCNEDGGIWDARDVLEISQCQRGCCLISDQAAFVPLSRCKKLSTTFGVEINFKTNINSEIECIAEAQAQDTGACVYTNDFETTCKFTTRGDCKAPEVVEVAGEEKSTSSTKFYKDYLCSASELGTQCAKQTSTGCYNGKVYFYDSCGNRENVYSANLEKSWNFGKTAEPDEICSANDGSTKDCGNCDYLLGSRCEEWEGLILKPKDSDYYCQRTECTDDDGNTRMNGESWCVYDGKVGNGKDKVGSRHFREICIDGEIIVEPCDNLRATVCIQDSIDTEQGAFAVSVCRVNRWQKCIEQDNQEDCENTDKMDCMWLESPVGLLIKSASTDGVSKSFSNPTSSSGNSQMFNNPTATGNAIAPITGQAIVSNIKPEDETNDEDGVCVPNYSPGLKFWEDGDAASICSLGNAQCTVIYEKSMSSGFSWECIENCECLDGNWALEVNKVCTTLGDCGGENNYQDKYTDDGYEWKVNGKRLELTETSVNKLILQR